MNTENEPDDEANAVDRREFIAATTAAASWWALTAKTDALAQTKIRTAFFGGGDPASQDYHYDEG